MGISWKRTLDRTTLFHHKFMAFVGRPAVLWRAQLSQLVSGIRAGHIYPCTSWNAHRHYSKKPRAHKGKSRPRTCMRSLRVYLCTGFENFLPGTSKSASPKNRATSGAEGMLSQYIHSWRTCTVLLYCV